MRLRHMQEETAGEHRYDSATLRKVTALAARLQSAHHETLTAPEIEAIGAEVGLEPAFTRQAQAQMTAAQPAAVLSHPSKTEFWSRLAAFTIPLGWCVLAAVAGPARNAVLLLLAPWPLAVLLGFLAGTKKAALVAGVEMVLLLTLPLGSVAPGGWPLAYFLIGAPLAGGLSWLGVNIREHSFPRRAARQGVPRQALLNLLFALQSQLEGQKRHCAFLSVDVVSSSEMKRGAPELEVEHSFGQFRMWVEEMAHTYGGEVQSAAGDGMMGLFPMDAGALRAARQLQEGLPRFNAEQNRLPAPFRIRCGVSAGEIAIEEGMVLGHLQSPVIDRAAALQKRAEPGDILVSAEVTAAALTELGSLAALPEPVAGTAALSWRAAQPPLSSP